MRALYRGFVLVWTCVAVVAAASPAHAQPLPTPHIIGGSDAAPGAFPYAAFVQINAPGFSASCSGSLIAANVVLTAGHCAFNASTGQQLQPGDYMIAVGFSDLSMAAGAGIAVSQVIPYPYFNSSTLQGDAALLVLSSPVLAPPSFDCARHERQRLAVCRQPATIMGWGVTSNAPGAQAPDILQTGGVAVQSNAVCNAAQNGQFRPGFDLCAAGPGFSPTTCFGDSGLLVATTATGPVEIGVDSYGLGQSCGDSPDYFTRVSSIQPWIASVLSGEPAPPVFVPAFVAPTPTAALSADGVSVSFPAPAADSACGDTDGSRLSYVIGG